MMEPSELFRRINEAYGPLETNIQTEDWLPPTIIVMESKPGVLHEYCCDIEGGLPPKTLVVRHTGFDSVEEALMALKEAYWTKGPGRLLRIAEDGDLALYE